MVAINITTATERNSRPRNFRFFQGDHKLLSNVYLFWGERETERQSMSGGAERQRHRIEAGSRLRAVSTEPKEGLESTNHLMAT